MQFELSFFSATPHSARQSLFPSHNYCSDNYMKKLPIAKTKNILVQQIKDEILIYNLETNQVHCLNKTAGIIWQNCDGKQTFEGLKKLNHGFNDDVILLSLAQLQKNDLLENNSESYLPTDRISRRAMISKYGSVAVALPVITMIVAPMAVSAQSDCGACAPVANGTAACVIGSCRITTCNAGFADCDAIYATGCETFLPTSSSNCGACGNACPTGPNARAFCNLGICSPLICNPGYANCDNNPSTGCEVDISNDDSNCGGCGRSCPSGETCSFGTCV